MRIHGTVVAVEVKPPHVVQEFFTGQRNPFVADEIEQQLVFLRGQIGFFLVCGCAERKGNYRNRFRC